ncbi:PLD nuclease N-terminal domain-containing protein [Marinactinospora thermotolerans]|uniref:Amino acid transporters n=1 Tax=Marinactinospora thermotolerans DSM 45154 TaxID=1122192 RepID=A0A1T4STP7_9ACTN|nr:PLD nuclease N-terminal domain-containing protein [Marinactinospora thermotolerans]SKA31271.1 Amino acid transporters [Marinactinospora thermotolerans DSM 45154]
MVWLGALITLLSIVLWVYAFFDALTSPAEEVRHLPKLLWLAIILLFMVVGPLLWLFLGRPRVAAPTVAQGPVHQVSADDLDPSDFQRPSGRAQPLGPDDDPDFLRRLNKRINPED